MDKLSDSDSDNDWSDNDRSLLDNAENIMQHISDTPSSSKYKRQHIAIINEETPADLGSAKQKNKATVSRKTKSLTKKEISQVVEHLRTSLDELVSKAIKGVKEEKFWLSNGYQQAVEKIIDNDAFSTIAKNICTDYINLYVKNASGKTKFSDFQLDWFQNYSKYMGNETNSVSSLLANLAEGNEDTKSSHHLKSCIVASLHKNTFDACSAAIISCVSGSKNDSNENCSNDLVPEDDFQLLKLNGWVLREVMAHTSKASKVKETEKAEWEACAASLLSDKSDLPSELKHIDKGLYEGMTFPKSTMLPFFRQTDFAYREITSEENQARYGRAIIQVTKTLMQCNQTLKEKFVESVRLLHNEVSEAVINKIYDVWLEKYLNARIQSTLIIAKEKLELDKAKKRTSNAQNLRDELKTYHVKPQSKK